MQEKRVVYVNGLRRDDIGDIGRYFGATSLLLPVIRAKVSFNGIIRASQRGNEQPARTDCAKDRSNALATAET